MSRQKDMTMNTMRMPIMSMTAPGNTATSMDMTMITNIIMPHRGILRT